MSTQGIKYTKQTMKLNIAWKAAKDFDIHPKYDWKRNRRITNADNGCNHPNGNSSELAIPGKYQYLGGSEKEYLYDYAASNGGNPRPVFTVKKGTKIEVKHVDEWEINYTLLDGADAGKMFTADLVTFRTCLIGESVDDLTVSKYRIFLNGEPLKAKYYTGMNRIKMALLNAFGYSSPEIPYYIADSSGTSLHRSDCKNVQIMQYDNNSKTPTKVDFDVLAFYDEKMK